MTTKKLLHVEDDPDIRTIAGIALETVGGFNLKQCESGNEALGIAEDFAPDILLLDAMMPGLSGAETLVALRKIDSMAGVPAIFMTAKVQPEEVKEFLSLGAIGVITKPFDPMKLSDEIDAMIKSSEIC